MKMKQRAEERRKKIVAHLATSHEDAERWDLEFWQQQTPQERLSALVAIRRDIERINREDVRVLRQVKRLRKRKRT